LFLTALSLACLLPFLHVLFASMSEPARLARNTGLILRPLGFTTMGYQLVAINPHIMNGFRNTIFYTSAGTAINILLTSMGAYVCAHKKFMPRNVIMFIITFSMFFNGGLVPYYLLVKTLRMDNSIWALLIPTAISAYNLILMRTSFAEIPDSLEESARIDGAGDFTILFRIIMPVSMPVVAVMVLLYAVNHWNSWFQAMIFIRNRNLYPLQLILREILIDSNVSRIMVTSNSTDATNLYRPLIKYSSIIVSIVPIICFYPFIQKYFVSGIMIGSIKG
jgi:putative aldouronate transport system permease protein